MKRKAVDKRMLVWSIVLITAFLPAALYWFVVGSAPTIPPGKALTLLEKSGSSAVLIDIRETEDFKTVHIRGAGNWPLSRLKAIRSKEQLSPDVRGKTVLLICRSGITSAWAARRLHRLTGLDVYSVKGGIQAWIGSGRGDSTAGKFRSFRTGSGRSVAFPYRELTKVEQWKVVLTAFGIKPIYMLLSLVLIVIMRRLRAGDLMALKWALVFFLSGEIFCAVNYLLFGENSYLVEYLHMFGMVCSFGFFAFALMEGLDKRVIKYGEKDERCAALKLCITCYKYGDYPCKIRQVVILLLSCFMILALIPLSASSFPISYNTTILGTPYHYSHAVIFQIYEIRFAPWAALVFLASAIWILLQKREKGFTSAKIFASVGLGFLAFSLFRLILFSIYRDNLTWFVDWEEFTELLYVGGVGIFLWIFRAGIFREDKI